MKAEAVQYAMDGRRPRRGRGRDGGGWREMGMVVFGGIYHAYTDQGSDVPGTRDAADLCHHDQFIADAFAGKLRGTRAIESAQSLISFRNFYRSSAT